MKRVLSVGLLVVCAALTATRLPCQCSIQATTGNVVPGVLGTLIGGTVLSMVGWDPDGPGPMPQGIVVGGQLTTAGTTAVDGVAFLDPVTQTFTRLGTLTSPNNVVGRLATGPQGQLFAVAGQRVLRWTGQQWQALSLQIDGAVAALVVLPTGEPVIGGQFQFVDGVPCAGLARHTATGWASFGFDSGTAVDVLATLPNGDLQVGGDLAHPSGSGGLATVSNGAVAFVLGAPGRVFAIANAPNGDMFVCGTQPTFGVYRRSAGVWSSLTSQSSAGPALHRAANGDLYVGGAFTSFEGVPCNRVARFDGTTWSSVGTGVGNAFGPHVTTIVDAPNGGVVVGGNFLRAGNVGVANLARWDGSAWSPFGVGLNQPARVVLSLPNGDVIVAGDFADLPDANGARCQRIARRSNGQWFAMGTGLDGGAFALARMPNGDIVVGGAFQHAGGVPCSNLARWDGTNWHAFGTGLNAFVHALAVRPNGDLLVGGYFSSANGVAVANVARWDGAQFHAFGVFNGGVESLAVRANGRVLAAGAFTAVDGQAAVHVAEHIGSAWSTMGSGVPGLVLQVVESRSGLVCAATPLGFYQWDGAQWQDLNLPSSFPRMCGLPDGSVLMTNLMGGNTQETRIRRYDGTAATDWASLRGGRIDALTVGSDEQVWCAGSFTATGTAQGNLGSAYLVQLSSTCPAQQVTYGAGCSGSGGTIQLTGQSRPWLSGTWRARATGLPAGAPFALQLVGFPSWPDPLSWWLPEGQPGCSLLVSPVLFDVLLATAGSTESAWPVPNLPALAGVSLALQHLPFEFGPNGLTGVFASNALLATVGSY